MPLSTQEQILIEQRVTNNSKSTGAAYLLWFFFGAIGGHRFYLGRTGTGFVMLALFVLGWATAAAGIGLVLLGILIVWALVDLFQIPGIIRRRQDELRQSFARQLSVEGGSLPPGIDMSKWSEKDTAKYLAQQAREGRT